MNQTKTVLKNRILGEIDDIIDRVAVLRCDMRGFDESLVDGNVGEFLTNSQLELEKAAHVMRIRKD